MAQKSALDQNQGDFVKQNNPDFSPAAIKTSGVKAASNIEKKVGSSYGALYLGSSIVGMTRVLIGNFSLQFKLISS